MHVLMDSFSTLKLLMVMFFFFYMYVLMDFASPRVLFVCVETLLWYGPSPRNVLIMNQLILSVYSSGRSNALNISQRLGVPKQILETAHKQIGVGTTEINQVSILQLNNFPN